MGWPGRNPKCRHIPRPATSHSQRSSRSSLRPLEPPGLDGMAAVMAMAMSELTGYFYGIKNIL